MYIQNNNQNVSMQPIKFPNQQISQTPSSRTSGTFFRSRDILLVPEEHEKKVYKTEKQ